MEITIKETYNSFTKDYSLYAVNSLGSKTFIGTSDKHRVDRQKETFELERKLNGHII